MAKQADQPKTQVLDIDWDEHEKNAQKIKTSASEKDKPAKCDCCGKSPCDDPANCALFMAML